MSLTKTSSQRKKGRHVMLPYKEVRQRFGNAIASTILADKKKMEAAKQPGDSVVYYMEHPEAKGQEDACLHVLTILVYLTSVQVWEWM